MKIEVAVNPHPPHQALFISNVVPGSVHDVTLFRQNIERYRVYLRKTTLEMQILPQDHHILLTDFRKTRFDCYYVLWGTVPKEALTFYTVINPTPRAIHTQPRLNNAARLHLPLDQQRVLCQSRPLKRKE